MGDRIRVFVQIGVLLLVLLLFACVMMFHLAHRAETVGARTQERLKNNISAAQHPIVEEQINTASAAAAASSSPANSSSASSSSPSSAENKTSEQADTQSRAERIKRRFARRNRQVSLQQRVPIGSYVEYRRCGATTFDARTRGEPLACSLSGMTELLKDPGKRGQTFYRQFRTSCNRHDFCYSHGQATYGLDRAACDKDFLASLLKTCRLIYPNRSSISSKLTGFNFNLRSFCRLRAALGYSAVRSLGGLYYDGNYQPACEYDAGPHAARDHVVAGKFLGDERDYIVTMRLTRNAKKIRFSFTEIRQDGFGHGRRIKGRRLSIEQIKVMDRSWACQRTSRHRDKDIICPQELTLGHALIDLSDLMRFSPLVIDHDGDGRDDIILPSISPDFGLAFTHIRFEPSDPANLAAPLVLKAESYLGVDRYKVDAPGDIDNCEWHLEFVDCFGAWRKAWRKAQIDNKAEDFKASPLRLVSHEKDLQNIAHYFVPLARISPDRKAGRMEDLALMSSFAFLDRKKQEEAGNYFRRFLFNVEEGRWEMRRDHFTRDGHPVAKCRTDAKSRRYEQYRRYQYRPFPIRIDGGNDALAAFQREKCPTSTLSPKAGDLGDVDLMIYQPDRFTDELNDHKSKVENGKVVTSGRVLQGAKTTWLPIIWSEAAHPIITSEEARKVGIYMTSTYVGGSPESPYPVISLYRASPEFKDQLLASDERRWPDTFGLLAERYRVNWDSSQLGNPARFYELPSVLAPFSPDGTEGLSLALFANKRLSAWGEYGWVYNRAKEKYELKTGNFHVLLLSLAKEETSAKQAVQLLQCPIKAIQNARRKRFSPGLAGYRNRAIIQNMKRRFSEKQLQESADQSKSSPKEPQKKNTVPNTQDINEEDKKQEWMTDFLKYEPILAGSFLPPKQDSNAKSGQPALTISWRARSGRIGVTSLHHDGENWKFGNEICQSVDAGLALYRLY